MCVLLYSFFSTLIVLSFKNSFFKLYKSTFFISKNHYLKSAILLDVQVYALRSVHKLIFFIRCTSVRHTPYFTFTNLTQQSQLRVIEQRHFFVCTNTQKVKLCYYFSTYLCTIYIKQFDTYSSLLYIALHLCPIVYLFTANISQYRLQ